MKIVLCCLLLAILFHPGQLVDESARPFRIIPIPPREHGYNNFASLVFMSKQDLDSFLKDTTTQGGWNHRQAFEEALVNAKLDFSKEALVLLRHSEGSGSVKVTFETPILKGRNLLCEIRGNPIPPGYLGTGDMAYYCFAVAVSKAHVSQVELQATEGGFSARRLPPIVLPIIEKQPANNLLQPSVKESPLQDCPTISVSCPVLDRAVTTAIKFQANVTGDKPSSEISYKWSVSKGTIRHGQGTAVIEVDFKDVGLHGLTATVEVNGLGPNCNRFASCTTATH